MDNNFCAALLTLVSELNRTEGLVDRFDRFLGQLRRVVSFDAATVLVKNEDSMGIIASLGLSTEAKVRQYSLAEHPRLEIIVQSAQPVVFPPDSTLSDPFDGQLEHNDFHSASQVHSCLGCPLVVQDEVVGCLTLDSLTPNAFDHLTPLFLTSLGALAGASLKNALIMQKLERESIRNMEWARELQRLQKNDMLTGNSTAMKKLRQEIGLVARSPFPVLILGETGTGKELVAKAIHNQSPRQDGPWITVNCAALAESLAESELFGHIKGAFTGAEQARPGKFELADGGTLFLDEIGDMPLSLQAKILRVIQEGEVQRLGADTILRVNVRIVAATHQDLEKRVADGGFRQDLFHRLHVFPLRVAPLRERTSDIGLLAACFAEETARDLGLGQVSIDPQVLSKWENDPWPGNIRELKNTVRATLVGMGIQPGQSSLIRLIHLLQKPNGALQNSISKSSITPSLEELSYKEALEEFKTRIVQQALLQAQGSYTEAARLLDMDRGNLFRLVKRLKIKG
jgi:anaerobic nitric oxide reductase transcription regulator